MDDLERKEKNETWARKENTEQYVKLKTEWIMEDFCFHNAQKLLKHQVSKASILRVLFEQTMLLEENCPKVMILLLPLTSILICFCVCACFKGSSNTISLSPQELGL